MYVIDKSSFIARHRHAYSIDFDLNDMDASISDCSQVLALQPEHQEGKVNSETLLIWNSFV